MREGRVQRSFEAPVRRPWKVLLVEDNAGDAVFVGELLAEAGEAEFELSHAATLGQALELLVEPLPDVALIDLGLPDAYHLEGVEALQRRCPEVPIVVITGRDEHQTVREALQRGAEDYLAKHELDTSLLVRTLRHAIERHHYRRRMEAVAAELRMANARLESLADRDPLTELINRRGLSKMLVRPAARGQRPDERLVLLVDLDDFKAINDAYGYAVGDVVLKEIASRLRGAVRTTTDCLARVGGDEFMVLLEHARADEAATVAERIREAIARPLRVAADAPLSVSASIGLARVPHVMASLDELLVQSGAALRRSKLDGKNRVTLADGSGVEDRRDQLAEAFRRPNGLGVVKQPIVKVADGKLVAYELLSRLSWPGAELPLDFLRLAMEANLLTLADHCCFRRCAEAARRLPPGVRRHINLLPSTLVEASLDVLLAELQGPPGSYCVEISEARILADPAYLSAPFAGLRRAGVLTALDDVGFGSSSLESLVLLEPDIVKLDPSRVQGIAEDAQRRIVLERLTRGVNALGAEVIAEGVESPADLAVLASCGIAYAQGFACGAATPEAMA